MTTKQHYHRKSTRKSRGEPSRRELLSKSTDEVQYLLPPEKVQIVTKRGLGINDYGFQRNASKSIYPYSKIILAPSNKLQYLERSKWSKALQLLDLSNNDIQMLPKESFWKTHFINLKCLYLHNNCISEWDGILGLTGAPKLISLTMFGNSISTHPQYRHFMVNHFTNLICLDGNVVVDAEIVEGLNGPTRKNGNNDHEDTNANTDDNSSSQLQTYHTNQYTPLNPSTFVKSMYILVDKEYIPDRNKEKQTDNIWAQSIAKRSGIVAQQRRTPSPQLDVLEKVNIDDKEKQIIIKPKVRVEHRTTKWILSKYEILLQDIYETYRSSSAVQTIQRYLRGFLSRKFVTALKQHSVKAATGIQKVARGYILRQRMNDELKELLDEEDQHLLISHYERQKEQAAVTIQDKWREISPRLSTSSSKQLGGNNIKLNIVLEQPNNLKDVSVDMTVTATATATMPKPSTPVEMSITKMIQHERVKNITGDKQHLEVNEIEPKAQTTTSKPKLRVQTPPIIDGIHTNVKLNLNLDRVESPLQDRHRNSGGMSPFRSRPSTGNAMDNIMPVPPTVSISKNNFLKSPKQIKIAQQRMYTGSQPSPKSPLSYMQQNVSTRQMGGDEKTDEEYVVKGTYPPTKRPTSSYSNRDLANFGRREKDYLNQQRFELTQRHRMEISLRAKEQRDQHKLNMYKRNLYSSSDRPSTTGSMARTNSTSDRMDMHKLKKITENETRKLLLLDKQEQRREIVLKQKEIEKQLLEDKEIYFAKKMEQISKVKGKLQREVLQARQIVHRQVKAENDKKLYKKLRAKAKRDRRYNDRLITAKFARSAIAMTRHVNKGIHAKLNLDRTHTNMRKVTQMKKHKRAVHVVVNETLKERYLKLKDTIDKDKLDHQQKIAWRQEKELQRLELKKLERKLQHDIKLLNVMVREGKVKAPLFRL